ncbi:MAG: esterase/lipase family protein [Sphingomonadaceae bacterium]
MPAITPMPEAMAVTTGDGCQLELRRHAGTKGRRPVLLVHGASAASATFRIGERQTLVDCLLENGFEAWTLDWRAGMRCAPNIYCRNRSTEFTLDAAARYDVPTAIARMRALGVTDEIAIVGHCMGGGIVAQGIAQGYITAAQVGSVVLSGLGLFYKGAIDNILKAEDRVLEEVFAKGQALIHPTTRWDPKLCAQDPGEGPWDPLLEVPYSAWLETPLHDKCESRFCHRLSYLYGMPYLPDKIPTIHPDHLESQFGYIPVQFYLHCSQNLRRGYAAPFGSTKRPAPAYLNRAAFRDLKVTLITGDLNSLWHRDSIDTMYEWLRRGRASEQPRRLDKHVLRDYGHQDLLWGTDAPEDVFPRILAGLS